MNKLLCALLLAGLTSAPAFAQSAAPQTHKEAAKKPAKKTTKKAAAAAGADGLVPDMSEEDLGEANIEGSVVTDYNCELGNKITTYHNDSDDKYMALRWKNTVHRLRRVGTSTGANRFENRRYGLVWISIPSKAMLLDSRKGQQLANECRNPEQQKALTAKKG